MDPFLISMIKNFKNYQFPIIYYQLFSMSHSALDLAANLIKELETKIDSIDLSPDRVNAGTVVYLGDGIAKVV